MECRERTRSEHRAHLAAIADIVERWHAGEITLAEKRDTIARENAFFHGRQRRSAKTGKPITTDVPEEILAVPERVPDRQDELWWQEA